MAILILCIRAHFATATMEALQDLVLDESWNFGKLRNLARFHRVEPIIYKSLLSLDVEFEQKNFVHKFNQI